MGDVVALVRRVLEEGDLEVERLDDGRLMTMLSGEHKRTIPVLVAVGDTSLHVTSLFTGVPDEAHAEVYALLLHRNERARWVHFALDDAGDVVLVGRVPLAGLDEVLLGELFGELLQVADETFDAVLRRGFASYLAVEQAWRRGAGLPANPIGDPVRSPDADGGSPSVGADPAA